MMPRPIGAADETLTHGIDCDSPEGARPWRTVGCAPAQRATAAKPKAVAHLTPAERAAKGKAARAVAPRPAHGEWEPAADRRDPVELLEEQAASRVPELVPIRYGRMLVSPFTFFRGAAYPMAADLAGAPRTGLDVQLCGDAHLSNFGAFAAPDRRLVFSINDFDETLPGPFEWDVKRLVASFAVAGRDRGFDAKQRQSINLTVTRAYREAIRSFAGDAQPRPRGTPASTSTRSPRSRPAGEREAAEAVRAQRRQGADEGQPEGLREAHARSSTASRRIVERPAADRPDRGAWRPASTRSELEEFLHGRIRSYRGTLPRDRRRLLERFRYAHAARKVVGVGSVGTRAWIVLMLGRDESDPLFLQIKEAQASVLEPFLGKSTFAATASGSSRASD